jgi:hypothetical protein
MRTQEQLRLTRLDMAMTELYSTALLGQLASLVMLCSSMEAITQKHQTHLL